MKNSCILCFLFLSTTLLSGKDVPLDTPTVVTGKLSSTKLAVFISNEDTVSGHGNGFTLTYEPVHHFLVSSDSLPPEKQKVRSEELRKAAAAGQTVTLHGSYEPLNDRVWPYWGCRAMFLLSSE
jgi:hypothetical protein